VDASALLALLLGEPEAESIAYIMDGTESRPLMSTVNYTEVLILAQERRGIEREIVQRAVNDTRLMLVAPSAREAEMAATARLRFPLNLGDCFAYALAKGTGLPLLTLDRDFRKTDLRLVSLR
jgi:ribonuclease VapC